MKPVTPESSAGLADVPSIKLIDVHYGYSRRRAARRHNEHVLKAAQRRQRWQNVKSFYKLFLPPEFR